MSMLVIGHRGAAGEAAENTLAAIERAIRAGADAVEIDIRMSRDGVPYVLHDPSLLRTTGVQARLRDVTHADIARINAGLADPVPTLDEALDVAGRRCAVFCELKGDDANDGEALVAATVESLARHEAAGWTAVHSFDRRLVTLARIALPAISAALVAPDVPPGGCDVLFDSALRAGAQAISIAHAAASAELVRRAHLRHLTVWAWTADRPDDWERLGHAGVDGVITNVPTALVAYLGQR